MKETGSLFYSQASGIPNVGVLFTFEIPVDEIMFCKLPGIREFDYLSGGNLQIIVDGYDL